MNQTFNKYRYFLSFVLASLARRKGKNLTLILTYTITVFLIASALFYTRSLRTMAADVLTETPEIVVQRVLAGRHAFIPADRVAALAELRGVRRAEGRLWGYYFDPITGANYTLQVPLKESLIPVSGTIVIGSGISRIRYAYEGDRISFTAYDSTVMNLKVASVLPPAEEFISADMILMNESDFRALTGTPAGMLTDIALTVRNERELPTIARKVLAAMPDTRPIIRDEILRTYDSVFSWRSGVLVVLIFLCLLAFVMLAWDKATGLSAEERYEIGVLKAVGWDTSDVLAMKMVEGAFISLFCFFAGALAAGVHVYIGEGWLFSQVLKGWSVLYPSFHPPFVLSPGELTALFLLTVLPYTAATVAPAWRSATADPDAVMR